MPVTVIERPRQTADAEYRRPVVVRDYVVSGTGDKVIAQLAILNYAPPYELGVDLQEGGPVQVFRNKLSLKEAGGGVWEGSLRYEASPDTVDLSINYGVRSKKIYQALKMRRTYDCIAGLTLVPGDDFSITNVPDFDTQIGVTADGVDGTDIEVGAVDFTITKKWKRAALNVDYLKTLLEFNSRTPTNHEPWTFLWLGQTLTFAKGSLRFRSSSVQSDSEEQLAITYSFAYASPLTDADDFTVGDSPLINAEGWDYLWTWYKKLTENGKEVTKPYGVIVNQVYPYKDFNELQIDA